MPHWFSKQLKAWYSANRRDLPWRNSNDPYHIWLSEVILQQTQVSQGTAYYLRFVDRFPHVRALAAASETEVLKVWQGLGYYSRARNLHAAARQVVNEHGGRFPRDYQSIRKLKGVGDYTAAAISSIAFGLPHAAVDGNVYRVLSRAFGISEPCDTTGGRKTFAALAQSLLDAKDPGGHNQALMEFGALHCRPGQPDCGACIFTDRCEARRTGMVSDLPVKQKKAASRDRYFNYLVIADKRGNVLLSQRNGNDIWKGLYEFPLIEAERNLKGPALLRHELTRSLCVPERIVTESAVYRHVLTHQNLYAKFYVVSGEALRGNAMKVPLEKVNDYPLPRLLSKFLEECNLGEML